MVIEDGNWQADIAEWEAAHEDKSEFPNWRKRDAGLGAFDVLEAYYAKLPLDRERRPDWDRGAVAKASLDIVSCEEYDDPMITDDLVPLKNAFILVARK